MGEKEAREDGSEDVEVGHELVADSTDIRIQQGDLQMRVHQPHGSFMLIPLYDGIEFRSRVTKESKATAGIQLTWEQAREIRDALDEILESNDER